MTDPPDALYPALGSLGAVGDGRSVGLFSPDGNLVWYCPLRMDADPVVWSLLDHRKGGRIGVRPADPGATVNFSYRGETAVLSYVWQAASGRARVRVAMPWPPEGPSQELWWVIEGEAGTLDLVVDCDPAPGFGRDPCRLVRTPTGVEATTPALALRLTTSARLGSASGAQGRITVGADQVVALRMSIEVANGGGRSGVAPGPAPTAEEGLETMARTEAAWRAWSAALSYAGAHRDAVVRSAVALKLLIYEPTGAVVAAATTSLPEMVGGVRNWDYRYCWLRDAGFTLNALYGLGCREEAQRYAAWMCRTTAASGLPLRVLYGVAGETELPEFEIEGVEGYRGSRPVRVGNAAYSQLQLDSYGELVDCLAICEILGDPTMRQEWDHFRGLVDFVADHWRQADCGIWEVRDHPRHFVHSKAMAWVALDRGARMAETFGLAGDVSRWREEAVAIRAEVAERGIDPASGRFCRAYDDAEPDASLLMLALVGFCDPSGPAMAATLDAVCSELAPQGAIRPGLLWRYRPAAGDGLPGGEGGFSLCGFWLVEALALAGRRDEAEQILAGLVGLAGELGLFAEELDPFTGEHLGNLPQAFAHVGLINAALCLYGTGGRPATSPGALPGIPTSPDGPCRAP